MLSKIRSAERESDSRRKVQALVECEASNNRGAKFRKSVGSDCCC